MRRTKLQGCKFIPISNTTIRQWPNPRLLKNSDRLLEHRYWRCENDETVAAPG